MPHLCNACEEELASWRAETRVACNIVWNVTGSLGSCYYSLEVASSDPLQEAREPRPAICSLFSLVPGLNPLITLTHKSGTNATIC